MIKNDDITNRATWAAEYIKDFQSRYSFDPISALSGGRCFPESPERKETLYYACQNYIETIDQAYKALETVMKQSI